jgi:hypothetical protein
LSRKKYLIRKYFYNFFNKQSRNPSEIARKVNSFCEDLNGVLAKYFCHHISLDHGIMTSFLKATPHGKAAVFCHNRDNAVQLGKKLWEA